MTASDAKAIAAYLGITPEELFEKYLSIDRYNGNLELFPKKVSWRAGRFITDDNTWDASTPCIFLDVENDNACKIHEVKPKGCRDFKCWEKDGAPTEVAAMSEKFLLSLGWDGKEKNADD